MYADEEFEFINLGISGNQTKDLVERLNRDFIEIKRKIHIGASDNEYLLFHSFKNSFLSVWLKLCPRRRG